MFKRKGKAKSVKNAVCRALDSFDYDYEVAEEGEAVYLTAGGGDLPLGMILAADEEHKTLNIYCRLMFEVPPSRRKELAVELNNINNTINNGSFHLDAEDGYITFKIIQSYRDGVPSQDLIKHLILISLHTADLHDGELKNMIPEDAREMMYR